MIKKIFIFTLSLSAVLCLPKLGVAKNLADFYQGKTVKLVVGSGVGAGYDNFARVTVRFLHLPGNPSIIVQNMPGARGIIAANYLYNIAPKDGTAIGMVNRYTIVQAVVGNKQARYNPSKFTWLGTPATYDEDPYVLVVRSDNPLNTIEDIRNAKTPLVVGNTGSALPLILRPALGMNVKVIEYKAKRMVDIALQRGEVDAMGIAYANLRKRHPDWLKRHFVRALVQFVKKRSSNLPNVVASSELATKPDQKALLKFIELPLAMAYPFVLPPGVPHDRAALIERTFNKVLFEPAYRKAILKQGLAYSPKTGEQVKRLVAELVASPRKSIQLYKKVVGIRGGK